MAQKRKKKKSGGRKVVRLDVKRAEKTMEQASSLMDGIVRGTDEAVALIVDHYREWERENPDAVIRQGDKMAMVRLGFIGNAGFDRCHETGRLPTDAFFGEDGWLEDELLDDLLGADALMCPAKESGACQAVWRGVGLPPCQLLLLEVYSGLGGGAYDERVGAILHDYTHDGPTGPDAFAKSFAEAKRLVKRYEPK